MNSWKFELYTRFSIDVVSKMEWFDEFWNFFDDVAIEDPKEEEEFFHLVDLVHFPRD